MIIIIIVVILLFFTLLQEKCLFLGIELWRLRLEVGRGNDAALAKVLLTSKCGPDAQGHGEITDEHAVCKDIRVLVEDFVSLVLLVLRNIDLLTRTLRVEGWV